MKNKFITFSSVFNYYSSLSFNNVMYKNSFHKIGLATGGGVISAGPAYLISRWVGFENFTVVIMAVLMIGIFALYIKHVLNPYHLRRAKLLGIKTNSGFYPIEFRQYQLEMITKYLGENEIDTSSVEKLAKRAKGLSDNQGAKNQILNISIILTVILPIWNLLLTWVFNEYVYQSKESFENLKFILLFTFLFACILILFQIISKAYYDEVVLGLKKRYSNFAGLLDDLILNHK